jgi:hypothetical protein
MFDDWRKAWREAVENFEREVRGDGDPATDVGMRRQLSAARGALAQLDSEIARAVADAAEQRAAEQVCVRRQSLAAGIADEETARIAGEYAARHAARAAVLERKAEVLRDERELLQHDLDGMELEIGARAAQVDGTDRSAGSFTLEDEEEDAELARRNREMDRVRREREADERLEELKRRMRT